MSTVVNEVQATQPWQLDATHTEIGFAVKHLMVSTVKGYFREFAVEVDLHDDDLTASTVRAEIDAGSIDTRVAPRDEHLRSADFFDVANHPKLVFESERIERVGADRLKVEGLLTIRGTTKPVVLDVELNGGSRDPWGNQRLGVAARTRIDRRDWGLTWNAALETGGFAVSHEVTITIEAELLRAA